MPPIKGILKNSIMKTFKVLLFCVLLSAIPAVSQAQIVIGSNQLELISGNVGFLKGQTSLNIVFSYEGMMVGDLTEDAYITKRKAEKEKERKGEAGKWEKKWESDKTTEYQPNFVKYFNATLKKLKLVASINDANAKYVMTVKITKTEPGFYLSAGVSRESFIDASVIFTEKDDPETILAELSAKNFVGTASGPTYDGVNPANFDVTKRLSMAYSTLGKTLAKYILKNLPK